MCSCTVSNFVGFKKPIAKVHAACRNGEEGRMVEQSIVGARVADANDDNVITLFLDQDRVCGVRNPAFIGASCFSILPIV
jgi:hypothetical protein